MEELEEKLGYRFRDRALLRTALTHSSYANEHRCASNERLEFVGDSVLGMVTAAYLYQHYPELPEGKMTRLRAEIVCEQSLWDVAETLRLGQKLLLGRGEDSSGGRTRPSILADAVEAVIAAVGYDPDGDLENSADSVFCSHGAGVVVKWNEVRQHMHIDTGWGREAPEEDEERWQRGAEAYVSRLAGDEELLRIFERTYGPIKKDLRAFRSRPPRREPSGAGYRARPLPDGPEYLLVDGYNIIFAWDELREIAQDSLDAARNRLIHLMCNYQGFRRCELILVFDAYKVKGNHGSVERVHNVSVVYTKEAETADMYIEKVTKEIGKRHRVRVATSDGLEQLIIIGHGALRVSAAEFHEEVTRAEKAIRDFLDSQPL